MSYNIRTAILNAGRIGVGIIFFAAGILKLPVFEIFVREVRNYDLVPDPLVRPFAAGIILAEMLLGLFLTAGWYAKVVAAALASLTSIFLIAIAVSIMRGLNGDCGCFGGFLEGSIGVGAFLRDVIIFMICIVLTKGNVVRRSDDV